MIEMKNLALSLVVCLCTCISSAQVVEFLVACNSETNRLEVIQAADSSQVKYAVVKRKLPNPAMGRTWIRQHSPDGTCVENLERFRPPPPSNAKPGPQEGTPVAPPKKISHYYRNKVLLYAGRSSFDLQQLPGFDHVLDQGYHFGFRYMKGNKVQFGASLNYNFYGSVKSYESQGSSEEVRWANVDAAMTVNVPIELHKQSGNAWLLPEAQIGVSWQNVMDAKPEDYQINHNGGSWFWQIGAGIELWHIYFGIHRLMHFQPAIEDRTFKFSGTKLTLGLSFK